jgi:hypothetical protein
MKLLTPGSLQHLGDNMLAFLLHTATSSKLDENIQSHESSDPNQAIYFDILVRFFCLFYLNLEDLATVRSSHPFSNLNITKRKEKANKNVKHRRYQYAVDICRVLGC